MRLRVCFPFIHMYLDFTEGLSSWCLLFSSSFPLYQLMTESPESNTTMNENRLSLYMILLFEILEKVASAMKEPLPRHWRRRSSLFALRRLDVYHGLLLQIPPLKYSVLSKTCA